MIEGRKIDEKARTAAFEVAGSLGEVPPVAVVLGSGWSDLGAGHEVLSEVDFDSVTGLAGTTVDGHGGFFRLVSTAGGPVLLQQGRLHEYEGFSTLEVTFPVWILQRMGVRIIIFLSAAGGLNPAFVPGDLMVVRDHVLLFGTNPLCGVRSAPGRSAHPPGIGIYPSSGQEALRMCLPEGTRCETGVYVYVQGPSYETAAEAGFLRMAGGDAVGMSTAPEALVARYLGLGVAALCCISNSQLPPPSEPATHQDVLKVVGDAARRLEGFLDKVVRTADMIV